MGARIFTHPDRFPDRTLAGFCLDPFLGKIRAGFRLVRFQAKTREGLHPDPSPGKIQELYSLNHRESQGSPGRWACRFNDPLNSSEAGDRG
jgi:hypothetical protein